MYTFNWHQDWDNYTYEYSGYYEFKQKIFNTYNIIINFDQYYNTTKKTNKIYYYPNIQITKKRKIKTTLRQTGPGYISGLILIKNTLLEFENFIKNKHNDKQIYIVILWSDNRRRNIYSKYLKKYGYKFDYIFQKCLVKKLI